MTEAGVLRCASFFMEIFYSTAFDGCRLMGESEFLCSFAAIRGDICKGRLVYEQFCRFMITFWSL